MKRCLRAAVLAAPLLVSGCGFGWLGGVDEEPLPGERVPVLLLDAGVAADPRVGNIAISLPPPERNPDWPLADGNASHAMHHLALGSDLRQAWQASIGSGSSRQSQLLARPVVGDGRVFTVDSAGRVSAFAADNGRRLWQITPPGMAASDRLRSGGIAYGDGRLFVTGAAGDVAALNAGDGSELWRRNLGAPIRTAPSIAGNRLLVLTGHNQLLALDPAGGDVVWQHAGFFEPLAILGGATPAVSGSTAVAAYSSGEVVALSLLDGRPIWSDAVLRPRRTLAIGAINDITGSPVIDRGRVIVAGNGGETAAFDLPSGARVWNVDVTARHTPWVAGDYVFLLTDRNELVAVLRQNGLVRWVTPLERLRDPDDPESTRIFWAGPILAGDRLILAGSTGEAISVSPYTGEVMHRMRLPGAVSLPPVVADATLYVLTNNGTLVAYR